MRRPSSIPCVCILLAIAAPVVAGTVPSLDDSKAYSQPDCGLQSLYLLLQTCDRPSGLAEIERALPERDRAGYSMAELRDAARARGLRLRGIRFGLEDVPLDRPAIAWLDRGEAGHFIVMRPVGVRGTMVQVLEPPHPPRVMDYDTLLKSGQWTGALLVPESNGEWLAARAPYALIALLPVLLIRWHFRRQKRPEADATPNVTRAAPSSPRSA